MTNQLCDLRQTGTQRCVIWRIHEPNLIIKVAEANLEAFVLLEIGRSHTVFARLGVSCAIG